MKSPKGLYIRQPGAERSAAPGKDISRERTLKGFDIERFRRGKGKVLPIEKALNGETEICCALSGHGE
jgi:hypothetical protein